MIKLENLNIKIFSDFNQELENIWINFEKESEHYFFQTFKWQKLWFNQMVKFNNKLFNYTIVIQNNNETILILPFYIKKIFIFKILSWSGFPFSDYNAPLIKKGIKYDSTIFNSIWKLIQSKNNKSYNCIYFDNQPEFIKNIFNPFIILPNTKKNNLYYGLNLNEISSINKNEIINTKYQNNRLKKIGNLTFKVANALNEKKKILSFIIKKKGDQFLKTNAFNIFKIESNKFFFIKNSLRLNANLSYLTFNNVIIAANMGYVYDKCFYYILPTYDVNYKKYSPGKILLSELLKYSKNEKLSYFDFTIGSEKYKTNWSNYNYNSYYMIKSINFFGFFYILLLKFKFFIKKFGVNNIYIIKLFNKIKLNVS